MARLETHSHEPPTRHCDSYVETLHEQMRVFAEESQKALENYERTGDIRGCQYKAPYADSFAVYRVVKVRPLVVQHVAIGDAWSLPEAHIRGLNAKDIERSLNNDIAWSRMVR